MVSDILGCRCLASPALGCRCLASTAAFFFLVISLGLFLAASLFVRF